MDEIQQTHREHETVCRLNYTKLNRRLKISTDIIKQKLVVSIRRARAPQLPTEPRICDPYVRHPHTHTHTHMPDAALRVSHIHTHKHNHANTLDTRDRSRTRHTMMMMHKECFVADAEKGEENATRERQVGKIQRAFFVGGEKHILSAAHRPSMLYRLQL